MWDNFGSRLNRKNERSVKKCLIFKKNFFTFKDVFIDVLIE